MSTFYYTTTFIDDRCSFDPEELEEYALRGRNNVIVERGQHTLMRFAVAIHGCNIERITTTYKLLSARHFMPPAVLLQTAGTIRQALCSEATIYMPLTDDSDIYALMGEVALNHARGRNSCVSLQRLDRSMYVHGHIVL